MSRADDDDTDDRPRRRRPRDDEYDADDDGPRRGGASGGGGGGTGKVILVVVVVGVVGLVCCGGIAAALLLPAVAKVREAAARAADTNNYRQAAIAFHSHVDGKAKLPAADGDLSWRVALLPYLEQAPLFQQFDQTQGWDGPRNRPLADTRVPPYLSSLDPPEFTQTRMRVFTGPDTLFPPGERPVRFPTGITDGTSNTLLAVEATESVPWPQPRELAYTKGGPLPALGHPDRPAGFLVMMADGSIRFVNKNANLNENAIRSAITPTANDPPPDF